MEFKTQNEKNLEEDVRKILDDSGIDYGMTFCWALITIEETCKKYIDLQFFLHQNPEHDA